MFVKIWRNVESVRLRFGVGAELGAESIDLIVGAESQSQNPKNPRRINQSPDKF